jgi:outer membrane receptor protein involved in Fe transport
VLRSLGGVFPADPFSREIGVSPGRTFRGKTEDWGLSGQVDWTLGDAITLTSITAYRDYKAEGPSDTDYSNVDILYRGGDGDSFRAFKTFSQEFRLQGSVFADRLDWLVGAYFADESLHVRDNLTFGTQYGAFAACRLVATVNPLGALRDPTRPGCLSPTGRGALTGAFGAAAPIILAGFDRLSTVNNVGDNDANYFQDSRNYAFFTHNIFKLSDALSLTLGARYTNEKKEFRANFNNTNTVCPTQQAFFSNFLTGGATPLPATLQPLIGGIVNLTCQGNSSAALNAITLNDERKEDEWTGTAILSWKPVDDLLMYASYSKGYKAGGFNLDRSALGSPVFAPGDKRNIGSRGAPFGTGNLQFDAEKVDAYEFGVKYGVRNMTFNAAIFRQEFKDFQLNTFNGSVFLVQNVNGCSDDLGTTDSDASPTTGSCNPDNVEPGVISQGFELEAAIYPHRDLQVTAGFTYADTKYRNNLVGRNTGSPLDPALFLLPGDNLSNAPEGVATASVTFTPDIGNSGLSALFYVDGRLSSDYNTGSDLFPEKEQDSFAVFNARIGIRGPDQRWGLELWAQNVFDVEYQQVAFNSPFQGANSVAQVQAFGAPSFAVANQLFSSFLAEPRMYGVTGRFRF